jgi:hypothetical protein
VRSGHHPDVVAAGVRRENAVVNPAALVYHLGD